VRARGDARAKAEQACDERLERARAEAEQAAEQLHTERMRRLTDDDG
jgi:hypothetical protein